MGSAAPEHSPASAPRPSRGWWLVTLVAVVGTFIVARAIPPFYPDGAWWGTFFTSAGFGGSLAVIGAGVASYIAYHNSREDRKQARDAMDLARWWDRFAWACEKAASKKPSDAVMGLSVVTALLDAPWAREEDNVMAINVFNEIVASTLGPEPAPTPPTAKDGWRQ